MASHEPVVNTSKDTKVPYFKNDPWVYVPFFLILACILFAAATNRISVEMASVCVGLLGFPSVAGSKKLSGLIAIIVTEVQKQMASMPPPPMPAAQPSEPCHIPPFGWTCPRPSGHEGPCVASQMPATETETLPSD